MDLNVAAMFYDLIFKYSFSNLYIQSKYTK